MWTWWLSMVETEKKKLSNPGAGIMEADDRQVTTVFTVQPSFHHQHSTNQVSWSVTIVNERQNEVWLHIRWQWSCFMILGLSSADDGMTAELWKLSSLAGRRPPWYRPQVSSDPQHQLAICRPQYKRRRQKPSGRHPWPPHHLKEKPHQLLRLAAVLIGQAGGGHVEEGGATFRGHCLGQHGLPCARRPHHHHPLQHSLGQWVAHSHTHSSGLDYQPLLWVGLYQPLIWVGLYQPLLWVGLYQTLLWVGLYQPLIWVGLYQPLTLLWVGLYQPLIWVGLYQPLTLLWVGLYQPVFWVGLYQPLTLLWVGLYQPLTLLWVGLYQPLTLLWVGLYQPLTLLWVGLYQPLLWVGLYQPLTLLWVGLYQPLTLLWVGLYQPLIWVGLYQPLTLLWVGLY